MVYTPVVNWMFAALLVAANICCSYSQEHIDVKGAKGIAFIQGDISENKARENAINEAKKNALHKARITEHINAYEQLFSSQVNNDYAQFFSSDIQSEIQGAVASYSIVDETKSIHPTTTQVVYTVVMDADVIKYNTKADYSFRVQVDSLQPLYKNEDKLTFTVASTHDCYLTIFNITDHDASVLFPNCIETDQFIQKEVKTGFPRKKSKLDYILETERKTEMNRLIFVFTKQRLPYLAATGDEQLTEAEKIMTWIYTIPPDQRCIFYSQFHILKN